MFSPDERDDVRQRLLHLAEHDPSVVGVAFTGSYATGEDDCWSDIDLAFAVAEPLSTALERWTQHLYERFAAIHHWDLTAGPTIYRVFLLPGCLEVDLAFSPPADFAQRGPSWRLVFGQPSARAPTPPSNHTDLAGLAWHHALHAWTSIQRRRWWQAEQWISALRTQTLALTCWRLKLPTSYAKGAHLLPEHLARKLEPTLVRSLEQPELHRALRAATAALIEELETSEPSLARRLQPFFDELAANESPPPT